MGLYFTCSSYIGSVAFRLAEPLVLLVFSFLRFPVRSPLIGYDTRSARKIRGITDGLFASVFDLFNPHTSACHNRLKEIEQEIEEKRKQEEVKANEEVKTNGKYNWGK